MGYRATFRAMEAARRRHAKEEAKLSAMEEARLEVENFDHELQLLLSVHEEQGDTWDWTAIAASLPGPCPQRNWYHEQKARQRAAVMPAQQRVGSQVLVEQARLQDEQEFQNAARVHSEQLAHLEKLKNMSRRILAGEHKAYTEALVEFNPFAELSDLGSVIPRNL